MAVAINFPVMGSLSCRDRDKSLRLLEVDSTVVLVVVSQSTWQLETRIEYSDFDTRSLLDRFLETLASVFAFIEQIMDAFQVIKPFVSIAFPIEEVGISELKAWRQVYSYFSRPSSS